MRYLADHEYALATRFLFLSMAITVIKREIDMIENKTKLKIKSPYLLLFKQMEAKAFQERQQLRKYMYDQKIQVRPLEKNDAFTAYLFICGEREEKRNYFNPTLRKKVEQILSELMMQSYQDHSNLLTNEDQAIMSSSSPIK
ncbi:hypothetical protein [Amphibacillus cookii]|uniref:hypothetical protein n=1 Tax=Amphibacillus cookii TaxID=767787 RepID=UPI00195B4727|nr:hypothetical protein [Amphibacillus cookii]MBM7541492.1 hypothetical protein [Amphibacillus cookii]